MITMKTYPGGIEVSYVDNSGATITKIIDPEELAAALSAQSKLTTGILPLGTRGYWRSNAKEYAIYQIPEHIRKISYLDNKTFTVPIPDLIFFIALNVSDTAVRQLSQIALFATKGLDYTDDTPLYCFPYGNVWHETGNICWGSVNIPTMNSIRGVISIAETFLGSVFNGHLDENVFIPFDDPNKGANGTPIRVSRGTHLMRYLDGVGVFPQDVLKASGLTCKDIERRLLTW